MNAEKLKRLQAQVRIGGKGTPRRKKKVTHQTAATDDKKLQSSLKKLSVSTIPGIEEVNIIKDDLTVIHFNNPKAQASLSANTFAVTGHGETKKVVEMLPEILPQLGQETVVQLRMFANSMTSPSNQPKPKQTDMATDDLTDDVPLLVEDFDQIAKQEASNASKGKPNAKPKNKPKSSVEDQHKPEKQSKSEQQIDVIKASEIDENKQANEKIVTLNEMKSQTVDQKPLEAQTGKTKEKPGKQNKNQDKEKSKELKETVKKDQSKELPPAALNNKAQKKNHDKKDPQPAGGNKVVQKPESNKDTSSVAANKGAPKDATQKDPQQPNKKTREAIPNKNVQQLKGNQNTQNQTEANKDVAPPMEKIVEKTVSINETSPIAVPKENIAAKTPSESNKKASKEMPCSSELKNPMETSTNPIDIAKQQQKINETSPIKEAKTIPESTKSVEAKPAIKDLALPIPPIIPVQPKDSTLATPETEKKLAPIPLGYKNMPDSNVTESSESTKVTVSGVGDNQISKPQDDTASIATEPSLATAVEEKQPEKNNIEADNLKSSKKPSKAEVSSSKAPPAEVVSSEIVAESVENVTKSKDNPTPPSQQKSPGAAKQPSNQKQVIPKEATKQTPTPSQQQQRQQKAPIDPKKAPNTENKNKKETENSKGKPAATKPQSASNTNAAKPQAAQQPQQPVTQKTSAPGQAPNKTTDKTATTVKPGNSPKTAPPSTANTSKKPTTANPAVSSSKSGNSATDGKTKPGTGASKPKAPAPQGAQGQQKQSKPRPNANTGTNAPNPKAAAEKQTDVKAATPSQTISNQ